MVRQLSDWNKFVKTVFQSERKKNPKCTFSDALKKASQLKKAGKMKGGDLTGEDVISSISTTSSPMEEDSMGESSSSSSSSIPSMMGGKTRKRKSGKSKKSGRKSRKMRKSRKSKK